MCIRIFLPGLGQEPVENAQSEQGDDKERQEADRIAEKLCDIARRSRADCRADAGCRSGRALREIIPAGAARYIGDHQWRHDADDGRGDAAENLDTEEIPRIWSER